MPEYGGGFAGDRAGLMNLEGQLGNISQMNMRQQQMDTQRAFMQNMMNFRDMALANQMHQQALMTPGQLALQRAQAAWYQAMAKSAGGGVGQGTPNPNEPKTASAADSGKPTMDPNTGYLVDPNAPWYKNALRSGVNLLQPLAGGWAGFSGGGALGAAMPVPHPLVKGALALGGGVLGYMGAGKAGQDWMKEDPQLFGEVPPTTPQGQAMLSALKAKSGVKSIAPGNVTKRANRGVGLPSDSVVPAPVSVTGPAGQ